jgi:CRISPR-associated protein Csc3
MQESDRICHLAKLGFEIAQPNGYKPHAVERLFREALKAITELRGVDFSKCDYTAAISGRIQKSIGRMAEDQAFIPNKMGLDARADKFAEFFVAEILNGICEGKPGRLKKMSNSLADGYYSATLSLRNKYWEEKSSDSSNTVGGIK